MTAHDVFSSDLDPSAAISPQIYTRLRDAIIRNRFAPGDRISESEIARACNVSRQPVREAFIKLAGEGLLAILPQRGTIISKINYTAVLDARFLREAIEADIVSILAAYPDTAVIRELRDQIKAQAAVTRTEPRKFIELDERFHRTLADAAGKRGAWRLIEGLKSQMDRVRFLSLTQFPVKKLIKQHSAVVDRVEIGDPHGANAAIRGHLREILSDLPQILGANPDFFDIPDGDIPEPVNAPFQGGVENDV
ncbi:GntR family transcriptional regulator [Ruegeria hyattellae]|uniref:GntR family transcriptional regulator n=1 Tax=Ruegeria hyattellae TaxID=3233337 RepID=UPI00355B6C90